MDDGSWGGGGGSVREWHDLSTWPSASAAAGLMLAGEGGEEGLIKYGLQQSQQNQQPCIRQRKVDGDDCARTERNDYVSKAGNDERFEGRRLGEKVFFLQLGF